MASGRPGFAKGFFYEPTVFIGTNDMRIAQEEIFGPVLTVIPYSGTDADAVRLANDSIYGLGGGVEARDDRSGLQRGPPDPGRIRHRPGRRRIRADEPGPGGGQGPGWGRPCPASDRAAPSADSSRAASAANGVTTASRNSPR